MRHEGLLVVLIYAGVAGGVAGAGCYQRRDPVVEAAQDLRRMADDFTKDYETKKQRLSSLRLGMSDQEVLEVAGPPSARQSQAISVEDSREVWTYRNGLQVLATLTFVNQRLTEIRVE